MFFDPPDVVHQLRIIAVGFDQLWRVQYLFEPSEPNVPFQRSRPSSVGSNRNASSRGRTKYATVRDEILGSRVCVQTTDLGTTTRTRRMQVSKKSDT